MTPARFITLEGIEGAGKTTVADNITRSLRARGITLHATREPGGTKVAERIRALVLAGAEGLFPPPGEPRRRSGPRQGKVDNLIGPPLRRGERVWSDRFRNAPHADLRDTADVRGAAGARRQPDPPRAVARRMGAVRSLHGCHSRLPGRGPGR